MNFYFMYFKVILLVHNTNLKYVNMSYGQIEVLSLFLFLSVFSQNLFALNNKKEQLTTTWMTHRSIMLSARSQTHKATFCMIPFI